MALCRVLGSLPLSSIAFSESCCLWRHRALFFSFTCSSLASGGKESLCCRIRATRGAVIFFDVSFHIVVCLEGLVIPSPPSRVGSAISSLAELLNAFWPVIDGRSVL